MRTLTPLQWSMLQLHLLTVRHFIMGVHQREEWHAKSLEWIREVFAAARQGTLPDDTRALCQEVGIQFSPNPDRCKSLIAELEQALGVIPPAQLCQCGKLEHPSVSRASLTHLVSEQRDH